MVPQWGHNGAKGAKTYKINTLKKMQNIEKTIRSILKKFTIYACRTSLAWGCLRISLWQLSSVCVSGDLEKPIQEQTAILGTITIGGSISTIDNLSDLLQVCLDAGAKRVLIPMSAASKIPTVPPDIFSKFQMSFYKDPIDAVYKSLALQ